MITNLWSDEKIALLKELWALNYRGAQIEEIMAERRMPTPKNAIYKKAQRLGLTPRASPIVIVDPGKTRRDMVEIGKCAAEPPAPELDKMITNYKAPLISRARKYERNEGCCWPIGDPKSVDFRFCAKKRMTRNYCEFHDSIAFNRNMKVE